MADPLLIAKNATTTCGMLPSLANRHGLITGATGTGKTFATYALLAEKDPQIKSWMVTTIDGAVEHYRNGNEHDMRRSKPDACGLLVLDDVGVDTMTEWASGALDRIINRRHERMLPTWVTTNLDPSDGGPLYQYLGNRAWSRLVSDAHVVLMGGKDRRQA